MPIQHFAAADYIGVLTAFCLFVPVALLSGYAIGALTDVLRFRSRTPGFRLAASVPLALAVGPILAYTVGRWWSLSGVAAIYGALSIYALYLLVSEAARGRKISGQKLPVFLGLIAIWLVIALVSLTDLQIGRRVYFSIIAFDYAVRTEFTQAIATFGIPAQNPFNYPGHASPLRYHYFWMALCAVVEKLGRGWVDARESFIAGTMWCGIGLISLIPLYLRLFNAQGAHHLVRRSIIGIALLGVTGLDILGAVFMLWLNRIGLVAGISPSVEWWNNQVDGWIYTMLWEPHYLCSLVACLTGFLVLWDVPGESGWKRRAVSGVVAGLAFASAVGSGIYVAMVFAAFLVVWTLITAAKRWYGETATLAIAGFTAISLAIPYMRTLKSTSGTGGQLLQVTVRSFDLVEILLRMLHLDRPWQILLGDLVMLPVNYFLELGFFFAAGWIVWRQFRKRKTAATRQELAGMTMAGCSIVICTFVKSSIISNNDLGWRGFLVAQFVLLLWGADLLAMREALPERVRSGLQLLLILGAAGVAYDLAILRFFPILSDAGVVPKLQWLATDERLGRRTYDAREAYEWLRARTPDSAIIQQNPKVNGQDTFWGMYGQRQTIAADEGCGTGFGGDARECEPILGRLAPLFAAGRPEMFDEACHALPMDVLVAKDTDPAWHDPASWVWQRPARFENESVRLVACRAETGLEARTRH